jgi:hypothetical protein
MTLVEAYVGLLGARVTQDEHVRAEAERIRSKLAWLWVECQADNAENALEYSQAHDAEGYELLTQIHGVIDSIDRLELTPLEIARAKANFIEILNPSVIPSGEFDLNWLGVHQQNVVAER